MRHFLKRVRLEKDWIVPTRWSWITETPLFGQAPPWVCIWTLPSEMTFAKAIRALLFKGKGCTNTRLIQSEPLIIVWDTLFRSTQQPTSFQRKDWETRTENLTTPNTSLIVHFTITWFLLLPQLLQKCLKIFFSEIFLRSSSIAYLSLLISGSAARDGIIVHIQSR